MRSERVKTKKTTMRIDKRITRNSQLSGPRIIPEISEFEISPTIVQSSLADAKYYRRHSAKKPFISERNCLATLEFT